MFKASDFDMLHLPIEPQYPNAYWVILNVGQNPPRTKPPLLIFVYVDKIPPMNFTTRT